MTKKNNCALSSANAWGSNNRKFYDIIDCVKFILLYQVHSFIFFSLWSILIEFQFGLIYLKFNELERFLIQLTHLSIIVQFLGFTGLFELQIPLLVIMSGNFVGPAVGFNLVDLRNFYLKLLKKQFDVQTVYCNRSNDNRSSHFGSNWRYVTSN